MKDHQVFFDFATKNKAAVHAACAAQDTPPFDVRADGEITNFRSFPFQRMRLPRRIGAATAKRLMFTADMIDAHEAMRIGLAEYVVPMSEFDAEIERLATRIVANSAFSQAAAKRLLDATDSRPLDAGLQWEVMETEGVGPDMQARIAAFTGKGK